MGCRFSSHVRSAAAKAAEAELDLTVPHRSVPPLVKTTAVSSSSHASYLPSSSDVRVVLQPHPPQPLQYDPAGDSSVELLHHSNSSQKQQQQQQQQQQRLSLFLWKDSIAGRMLNLTSNKPLDASDVLLLDRIVSFHNAKE